LDFEPKVSPTRIKSIGKASCIDGRPITDTHASNHSRTMSSAMATQQFAANVLRTGARKAGRSAPVRANRMTVRAAASNGGLPIDLRGAFPTDSFASPAPHSTVPAHRRGRDPSRKRASRGTPIDPSRVFGRRARGAPSPARAREKNRASAHPSRHRIGNDVPPEPPFAFVVVDAVRAR
jgi:hypothetical protein